MSVPKENKKGTNDNVKVGVRARPFNAKEIDECGGELPPCTLQCHSETVISAINPQTPEQKFDFAFDHVFWSIPDSQLKAAVPYATQPDVYEHMGKPSLDNAFDGFNGCIFAYGQTSSGKTHSMMGAGAKAQYSGKDPERGLTPRLCEELFERIEQRELSTKDIQCSTGDLRKVKHSVFMSFLEIYNEKVKDLLTKKKHHKRDEEEEALPIIHDPKLGPTVKGLTSEEVFSWDGINDVLERGFEHRTTAATAMNDRSSRSHCIVQLTLIQDECVGLVGTKEIRKERRSRMNLVDLAGSEKVMKSKVEGENLKEAIGINKSLTVLGRVIDLLIKSEQHIPYRDSMLTGLLSDSLGGNSRTTMLAALSPAAINYEETLSTLRYAARARQIVNVVKVNEDPAAALITQLREELEKIKNAMKTGDMSSIGNLMGEGFGAGGAETMLQGKQQAEEMEKMIAQLQEREQQEQVELERRAQQWSAEKEAMESKHQAELNEMEEKHNQLLEEQRKLEAKQEVLEEDIKAKTKAGIMQRFSFAAKIAAEKNKQQQAKEEQDKLKKNLIVQRFRSASQKAKGEKDSTMMSELKGQLSSLEAHLAETQRQLVDTTLTLEESNRGWQDCHQELNDALNRLKGFEEEKAMRPGSRMLAARQKELDTLGYSEKALCDMCMENVAQYTCPSCSNEAFCIICDVSQHRALHMASHQRYPINIWMEGTVVCEFCGAEEAEIMCMECENGRLCTLCDTIKHKNPKRGFHTRRNAYELGYKLPTVDTQLVPNTFQPTNATPIQQSPTVQRVYVPNANRFQQQQHSPYQRRVPNQTGPYQYDSVTRASNVPYGSLTRGQNGSPSIHVPNGQQGSVARTNVGGQRVVYY